MVDEGDNILEPTHQADAIWPRRLILLSALPRDSWSAKQNLSFTSAKGKKPHYIDAAQVFPIERQSTLFKEPDPLKGGPEEVVKFAAQKAEQ